MARPSRRALTLAAICVFTAAGTVWIARRTPFPAAPAGQGALAPPERTFKYIPMGRVYASDASVAAADDGRGDADAKAAYAATRSPFPAGYGVGSGDGGPGAQGSGGEGVLVPGLMGGRFELVGGAPGTAAGPASQPRSVAGGPPQGRDAVSTETVRVGPAARAASAAPPFGQVRAMARAGLAGQGAAQGGAADDAVPTALAGAGGVAGRLGQGEAGALGRFRNGNASSYPGSEGAGSLSRGKGAVPDPDGDAVYSYVQGDVVDVYSDMEGLESEDKKTIEGKKLTLATQLMRGEKVTVSGPPKDGWVEVYIPGQDLRGWIPAAQLSGDQRLASSFPVRKVEPDNRPGPQRQDPRRQAFVEETAKLEGVPYVWGGRSPRGVDCSGLVQLAASYVGMGGVVPRTSRQQKASSIPIQPGDLQQGDLIFTSKTQDRTISHVLVYLGNGMVREAPQTGSVVQTRDIASRLGFRPDQVRGYDDRKGVHAGKYYVFFGTFFK